MGYKKYDGTIKRRGTVAFVDSEGDSKKPICARCEEKGFDSKANMVPYINTEGVRDDNYKRCSTCGDIVPTHELKYESELEDFVDVESANRPAAFEIGSERRSYQKNKNNDVFQVEDYPLCPDGRPDKDLEAMLRDRPGIVTYIEDSNIDEQEGEY